MIEGWGLMFGGLEDFPFPFYAVGVVGCVDGGGLKYVVLGVVGFGYGGLGFGVQG